MCIRDSIEGDDDQEGNDHVEQGTEGEVVEHPEVLEIVDNNLTCQLALADGTGGKVEGNLFVGLDLALDKDLPVSYTHLRAHETPEHLVCRLLLEKKKKNRRVTKN
eukprot:TRINITY_DN22307_c0_g1_i3.p1 TRINITY_DN22307_c0_g1~~TRINITY_DN22307_c0_g1_i3.p1  ORF type:complete len:106 (-),score=25.87 TRINITY_DN22307_c0_g1_i3:44-361(-)